jgi:translocator protein
VERVVSSKYNSLIAFLLLTVGGGLAIGLATIPGAWYAALNKPAFNPPNWIFGPVWTILYVLIGIAGWKIWTQNRRSLPMRLWFLALFLNFLWSPIFFGAQRIEMALVVIFAMLVTIIAFISVAYRVSPIAAGLFVPYALWVGFATLLNGAIFLLN